MKTLIATLLGGAALLAAPLAVQAQPPGQWVAVPPGFTAVLVPDAAAPIDVPMPPDPALMIPQMNALFAQVEQTEAAVQAQFVAMQNVAPESGVTVTTISDGSHSCTERITYPGNGAQAQVQLTSTANGCALAGMGPAIPAALPNAATPAPAQPRLIEARAKAGAMVVADRD